MTDPESPSRIFVSNDDGYMADGLQALCSYIGINHPLKDRRPALMVSGINHGPTVEGFPRVEVGSATSRTPS